MSLFKARDVIRNAQRGFKAPSDLVDPPDHCRGGGGAEHVQKSARDVTPSEIGETDEKDHQKAK